MSGLVPPPSKGRMWSDAAEGYREMDKCRAIETLLRPQDHGERCNMPVCRNPQLALPVRSAGTKPVNAAPINRLPACPPAFPPRGCWLEPIKDAWVTKKEEVSCFQLAS